MLTCAETDYTKVPPIRASHRVRLYRVPLLIPQNPHQVFAQVDAHAGFHYVFQLPRLLMQPLLVTTHFLQQDNRSDQIDIFHQHSFSISSILHTNLL